MSEGHLSKRRFISEGFRWFVAFISTATSVACIPSITSTVAEDTSSDNDKKPLPTATQVDKAGQINTQVIPVTTETAFPIDKVPHWMPPTAEQVVVQDFKKPLPNKADAYEIAIKRGLKEQGIAYEKVKLVAWANASGEYRFVGLAYDPQGKMLWTQVQTDNGLWSYTERPLIFDESLTTLTQVKNLRIVSIPNSQGAEVIPGGSDGTLPLVVKQPNQDKWMLFFNVAKFNNDGSVGSWEVTQPFGIGEFALYNNGVYRLGFNEKGGVNLDGIRVAATQVLPVGPNSDYAWVENNGARVGVIGKERALIIRDGQVVLFKTDNTERPVVKEADGIIRFEVGAQDNWVTVIQEKYDKQYIVAVIDQTGQELEVDRVREWVKGSDGKTYVWNGRSWEIAQNHTEEMLQGYSEKKYQFKFLYKYRGTPQEIPLQISFALAEPGILVLPHLNEQRLGRFILGSFYEAYLLEHSPQNSFQKSIGFEEYLELVRQNQGSVTMAIADQKSTLNAWKDKKAVYNPDKVNPLAGMKIMLASEIKDVPEMYVAKDKQNKLVIVNCLGKKLLKENDVYLNHKYMLIVGTAWALWILDQEKVVESGRYTLWIGGGGERRSLANEDLNRILGMDVPRSMMWWEYLNELPYH